MTRAFFDTNILVYLFDEDEPVKKAQARRLLEHEVGEGSALLSTQVLQEFYVSVVRKFARPLSPDQAEHAVRQLAALPLVQIDAEMILAAIARSKARQLSFWDALIIQSALAGGAQVLYSEDLQHGSNIDGLQIKNPFLGTHP